MLGQTRVYHVQAAAGCFDAPWLAMELLWGLYINISTWKMVYRPFGSIGFHAAAGIPAFRVQRVKRYNVWLVEGPSRPYFKIVVWLSLHVYFLIVVIMRARPHRRLASSLNFWSTSTFKHSLWYNFVIVIEFFHFLAYPKKGPFKCYVTQWGGGTRVSTDQHYKCIWPTVISITRGWVSNLQEKTIT